MAGEGVKDTLISAEDSVSDRLSETGTLELPERSTL